MELIDGIAQFLFQIWNFVLLLIVGVVIWAFVTTKYSFFKRGYQILPFFGREPGDGWSIAYEEKGRSLTFSGPDENYTLKIPSERLWNEIMPDWAKGRKNEIIGRLTQDVKTYKNRNFVLKEYDDRQQAEAILASDQSISGENKTFYVIKTGGGGVADRNKLFSND